MRGKNKKSTTAKIVLGMALGLGFALNPIPKAGAQTVNDAAGLSMPLDNSLASARSAAFASSFVAVADDGSALFWNQAGLGTLSSGELSLHHQAWVGNTNLETLLVALPLEGLGGIGVAAHFVDYGSFEGRDSAGTPMAPATANRIALEGGWGYSLTRELSAGLGLRYSQENLAGNSYRFISTGGGLLFRVSRDWNLGLAFNGLGENGNQGLLPWAVHLGGAFTPELSRDLRLVVSGAGSLEAGGISRIQAGAEAVFEGRYAVRAGYQFDLVDNQWEGLNGLTLGAGYRWEVLSLDYAFLPMGDLGTSHRLSLSYHFGSPASAHGASPSSSSQPELKNVNAPGDKDSALAGAASPSPAIQAPSFEGKPPAGPSANVTEGASAAAIQAEGGDDLEIQFKLSPNTLKQGKDLEQQGRYQEALDLYIRTIHEDQKNLLAWWGLGNIYIRLGRKDYAVHCFEEVLKIKPEAAGLRAWLEKYRSLPVPTPGTR